MQQGEVWQVRLPFMPGHAQAGERPAVIITDDSFIPALPTVLIVPFTGSRGTLRFSGTLLVQSDGQMQGISKSSKITRGRLGTPGKSTSLLTKSTQPAYRPVAACSASGVFSFTVARNALAHGTHPFGALLVGPDGNIDPAAVEARITPRTKAILPVHLAGLPCDLGKLWRIASRHRIFVIEDAAHAVGVLAHVGEIGDA